MRDNVDAIRALVKNKKTLIKTLEDAAKGIQQIAEIGREEGLKEMHVALYDAAININKAKDLVLTSLSSEDIKD